MTLRLAPQEGPMKVRLLRGQVVVRELSQSSPDGVWLPAPAPRKVKTHTGVVLGMGPPALTRHGRDLPHDFVVGDIVQYHYTHNQDAHTRIWPPDGEPAVWVPQINIDAVWEFIDVKEPQATGDRPQDHRATPRQTHH